MVAKLGDKVTQFEHYRGGHLQVTSNAVAPQRSDHTNHDSVGHKENVRNSIGKSMIWGAHGCGELSGTAEI